jgi:hypothetical protein
MEEQSRELDMTYDVGFGRPPKEHRFKKGQSGNPKGRPKGARNYASVFETMLSVAASNRQSGEWRRPTIVKLLESWVERALDGERTAIFAVYDLMTRFDSLACSNNNKGMTEEELTDATDKSKGER